jgi:hypothetical protein
VLLSILTPLVLVVLTFVVNDAIQQRGAALKREEQILAEKQKIYAEMGKMLNVIYVYVADAAREAMLRAPWALIQPTINTHRPRLTPAA